jgi:hypothetical protein
MTQPKLRRRLMSAKEELARILELLPEERLRQVLDFAEFLSWQKEGASWRQFGKSHPARAYGAGEPEYTDADVK